MQKKEKEKLYKITNKSTPKKSSICMFYSSLDYYDAEFIDKKEIYNLKPGIIRSFSSFSRNYNSFGDINTNQTTGNA
ncbi:hypothetical protein AYI70_g11895 [Smittium culicis]|uniref:Uncharacterized protein n=1 Tax=Smittium culicis TaxID=133412 RepID=A0A1R1WZY0_9FUNG|nr:hypothetical protein AYI70_g11895 [Smittium culicis]